MMGHMSKAYLFVAAAFSSFLSAQAHAVDLSPKTRTPSETENRGGGGAADFLNMTKLPDAFQKRDPDKVEIGVSCTTQNGLQIKQDETGYTQCMDEYRKNRGSGKSGSSLNLNLKKSTD